MKPLGKFLVDNSYVSQRDLAKALGLQAQVEAEAEPGDLSNHIGQILYRMGALSQADLVKAIGEYKQG